jgi:hypothetical protein
MKRKGRKNEMVVKFKDMKFYDLFTFPGEEQLFIKITQFRPNSDNEVTSHCILANANAVALDDSAWLNVIADEMVVIVPE